ncbi:hypothetical protein ACP4OV_025165 [Aristida adscensionis]
MLMELMKFKLVGVGLPRSWAGISGLLQGIKELVPKVAHEEELKAAPEELVADPKELAAPAEDTNCSAPSFSDQGKPRCIPMC